VPFVVIQVIMVSIVIAFPGLVTGSLTKSTVDPSKIEIEFQRPDYETEPESPPGTESGDAGDKADAGRDEAGGPSKENDPDDIEKAFKQRR